MKKILLVGDINSAHFQRWAVGIRKKGFHVAIWSLEAPQNNWWDVHQISFLESKIPKGKIAVRIKYFVSANALKKAIASYSPDIVHAHYASGYGLVLRKTGFHPSFLSVWGSDVMDFPYRNKLNSRIIKKNLHFPDKLFATSPILKEEVLKWSARDAAVIPFGVDTNVFKPGVQRIFFAEGDIVFGTIKTLAPVYGIDILIQAFSVLKNKNPQLPLKLLIAGNGPIESELKQLAERLLNKADYLFTGKIPFERISSVHQELDVFVNVSRNESFGVAVLEASASGKPVIVTRVGGLPGVVAEGRTGFLVSPEQVTELEHAMSKLLDAQIRESIGKQGREFVIEKYDWNNAVDQMCNAYLEV